MAYTLFITELISAFVLAACLLYRYGNCYRNHIVVTLSVLTAWYFSFLIILILPLDVTSTVYRKCLQEHNETDPVIQTSESVTVITTSSTSSSVAPFPVESICVKPWSWVPDHVFPNLWRIVYWSSQCLTWLIMPMMQSYSKAGDFTVKGKLKSALIDNAIYYGSYLSICGVLLIYIALKPGVHLDGQKIKAIASSASNTWGLFLLIMLFGYALVEIPRNLWNNSKKGYTLTYSYFKAAKLSSDKCEAEETFDDILRSLQAVNKTVGVGHPLQLNVETILQKVPLELRERMNRLSTSTDNRQRVAPTHKSLVLLHKQTIKALQVLQRTDTQWNILVEEIFHLEDVAANSRSVEARFKPTFQRLRSPLMRIFYSPIIEWYWECFLKSYILRTMAVLACILSISVVWSEMTFFNISPVLSIFAKIVNAARESYDYMMIVIFSTLMISYLGYCAYSTVLKIRLLNLYYLAPHHQTNEYSLIFSGMMVCRLTPPLCLNFLGLIHMDSHIIKEHIMETSYTRIMGHMDVLSIIADGFNIYFPMAILLFCLFTYFSLGSRLLSMCGFQQFVGDDELTTDLVDEGREIIKREKRKRQRAEESMLRRRNFHGRFTDYRGRDAPSDDAARAGLLRDTDRTDYYATPDHRDGDGHRVNQSVEDEIDARFGSSTRQIIPKHADFEAPDFRGTVNQVKPHRTNAPPRGIFDDV